MPAFPGFSPDVPRFLAELAAHNEKAWFEANRDRYERHLLEPARAFVSDLAPLLHALDPSLSVQPRVGGSIFRIHRDVRFSADKRPYKEELAFRFPGPAGSALLMRIRPDLIGFGAGVWAFEKDQLHRYRQAVASPDAGPALAGIMRTVEQNGCRYTAEGLKRVPAPWAADHPRGELLKLRGLVAGVDEALPACMDSADFVPWCGARFARLLPLHRWLSDHVG